MSQTPDFVLGDEFARILTETTMSLVCVLGEDGRVLFFNDACERLTGFTRDEVVGRDAREFVIPPEEAEAFGEVLAYVWKTGLSSPQVGHWVTKDGERKLIAWSNRLMVGEDATPTILVTTGIELGARDPRVDDEGAFEGDPEAKLAEIGRLAQEQRALRRVATLVASEASPERVFTAVSEECARVLEVEASAVFRYEGDDTATVVGRYTREETDPFQVGVRIDAPPTSGIGQVLRTGAPARVSDYTEREGEVAEMIRSVGYSSTVSAPIIVAGILWGAVGIASAEPLPVEAEQRLSGFCELVSLAVASAQARADLSASRARLVKAGDEQRRKLERNLHDGAQQRLVSLALTLRLARRQLDTDTKGAAASLENAANELTLALEELRELARGLHPAALTEQGLGPALRGVAGKLPLDVQITAPDARLPENIEATVYYIVLEALTNVVKHAQATSARVTIEQSDEAVRFEVVDDGRGGADPSSGSGILGLRDRAEAVEGTLFVISPPGQGTIVRAQIPLSPS